MIFLVPAAIARGDDTPADAATALDRTRAYLLREVPRWSRENRCFSCHHDGDGPRALAVLTPRTENPDAALQPTLSWLRSPESWDRGDEESPFRDQRLGRLQFAAALADVTAAGWIETPSALQRAAARLAGDQADDGSWPIDGEGFLPGGPTTLGRMLVTAEAIRVLRQADAEAYAERIQSARAWLATSQPRSMPEFYAVTLGLPADHPAAIQARDRVRANQNGDGGWGPFPNTPDEVFDTALGVLSLVSAPGFENAIERGQARLRALQGPDGAWIETTRPTGGESEAQRLSTTAWAARALLARSPSREKGNATALPSVPNHDGHRDGF